MRIRIGIFLAYLLLGCILLEDALPYFADANKFELCETKTEGGEKETKKEKEVEEEWKAVKDRLAAANPLNSVSLIHPGSIFSDSDVIPDSAHRAIFSPPPNRV